MAKYIITGASGFVGRHFASYLRQNEPEAKILGLDRASNTASDIKYRQIDLLNQKELLDIIAEYKPDYLLHLASISSVAESWNAPSSCFKNNTGIMLNILDAVKEQSLKTRILSVGSSEEYGTSLKENMPFSEEMPLNPKNPYAVAKAAQEMLCKLYAESFGINVMMTRSFNHIGPKQSDRFVVASFIRQLAAVKKGRQTELVVGNIDVARDFTDVRDVVAAYYKILHLGIPGEVYNVCSEKSYRLKEIIKLAEELLNIQAVIKQDQARCRPNETMLVIGANKKIRENLGWHPQYSLRQTLKDIINDYIKEG